MRILILIFAIHFSGLLFGQQDVLSGMFWNNYAHVNPATTGMGLGHEANITYRDQWVRLDGHPTIVLANYNTVLLSKHGIGVNYIYNRIGYSVLQNARLNYNYQLKFVNQGKLSLGISTGLLYYNFDPDYNASITENDPFIPEATKELSVTFNTGVAYKSDRKKIYTGIGVTNITPKYKDHTYQPRVHLYAHFRYGLLISRRMIMYIETIARTDLAKYTQDLNVRINYKRKLMIGLSGRSTKFIGANISYDIKKQVRIGYCYEYFFGGLPSYARSTHEIVLGFRSKW